MSIFFWHMGITSLVIVMLSFVLDCESIPHCQVLPFASKPHTPFDGKGGSNKEPDKGWPFQP